MSKWLDKRVEEIESRMGEEKSAEIEADVKFFEEILGNDCDAGLAASSMLLMIGESDVITVMRSLFYGGVMQYREWLLENGVDVLKLGGRK